MVLREYGCNGNPALLKSINYILLAFSIFSCVFGKTRVQHISTKIYYVLVCVHWSNESQTVLRDVSEFLAVIYTFIVRV